MSIVLKKDNMQGAAAGVHTTVTASDTVVTGLREVWYAYATLGSDAIAAAATVSVAIPDQVAGGGTIQVKTWTSTQVAGTTFARSVYWYAVGR